MHRRPAGARFLGLLLAGALLPLSAHAAEATDVLDALDGADLFDANAEISYRAHTKTAKITREDIRGGKAVEVAEFQYFEHSHQVIPRLRVGVFQDVEFFLALPVTAWEQRLGWFHPRTGNPSGDPNKRGYSTFVRDMCMYGAPSSGDGQATRGARPKDCDGYGTQSRDTLSGEPSSWPVNHQYQTDQNGDRQVGAYNGNDSDWNVDPNTEGYNPQFNTIRGAFQYNFDGAYYMFPKGLGDAEIGLAFSPYSIGRFNDYRDSAMPSMRIELKYQVPTGYIDTPSPAKDFARREALGFVNERRFEPGGVGSGLHRLTGTVAMSKRYKALDPYLVGRYTLGIPHYYPNIAGERLFQDFAFWTNTAGGSVGVEVAPLYYAPEVEEYVNLRFMAGFSGDFVAKHRAPPK